MKIMKKQWLGLVIVSITLLFTHAQTASISPQNLLTKAPSWQNPLRLSIQSVDMANNLIQLPSMDLRVGESGLVWHRFDSNYSSVIAEVTITALDSGVATARINATNILTQKYLPTPTNAPEVGDFVYFRTLNNQAFIIAPTLESYEQVRSKESGVRFLNSDLLLAYLFDVGGFDPKPQTLSKACRIYNAGLLYVISSHALHILDCQSLVVLEKRDFPTDTITQTSAPFFSRILHTASGTLDSTLRKKRSKQYFLYYDTLIAQGRDFKPSTIGSK